MIFCSALTKQRIFKVLETAVDVYKNRRRQVPTSQLNKVMLEAIANYPPPANKGKYVKIKYVSQLKGAFVPTFIFFCNLPQWVKEPYRRFLENQIREHWDFNGTPSTYSCAKNNLILFAEVNFQRGFTVISNEHRGAAHVRATFFNIKP